MYKVGAMFLLLDDIIIIIGIDIIILNTLFPRTARVTASTESTANIVQFEKQNYRY